MGKVLFIACTPVARAMMQEIKLNPDLNSVEIAGIVNLNSHASINKANYDSYSDLVIKYDIPIFYCDNVNDDEVIDFIKDKQPDIIIQSGWSQKFEKDVLNTAKHACIGEHPAPLPKGRGAACVNWAILTGETKWGDTFFKMEPKYDDGVMYAQEHFRVELYDNVKTVYDKVAVSSVKIIRENIVDWTNGILNSVTQDDTEATYYARRSPSDGIISFDEKAINVYNKIRAQTRPYPGAFFQANVNGVKKNISVWDAEYSGSQTGHKAGEIFKRKEKGGVGIVCEDGIILTLKRIQIENSQEVWAYDLFSDNDIKLI